MYAKVLHRKVRICFGRILPILARCQDAATVYVSGVDVIDGSAVPGTENRFAFYFEVLRVIFVCAVLYLLNVPKIAL